MKDKGLKSLFFDYLNRIKTHGGKDYEIRKR